MKQHVLLYLLLMLIAAIRSQTYENDDEHLALFVKSDLNDYRPIDYTQDVVNQSKHSKRQIGGSASTDIMVGNILKWLQNVYGNNKRKARQQSANTYLPPVTNPGTESPRPFGYDLPGPRPQPPFGYDTPTPGQQPQQPQRPVNTPKPVPYPSRTPPAYTTPQPSGYPSSNTQFTGQQGQTNYQTNPRPSFTSTPQSPSNFNQGGSSISSTGQQGGSTGGIYVSPNGSPIPGQNNYPTEANRPGSPSDNNPSYIGPPDDGRPHPPHIHAIDVICSKERMVVNLEFNEAYNGIIYSKNFHNNPECIYVRENSNQIKYQFTLSLNNCGTQFINAFDTEGQSYLENVLVLQNEPGIQEVWDSIRSIRCLWEGNINQVLNVALNIGMLNQEIVTFSGDTAEAKLDLQVGRGPFAPLANGLVKIGELMTLVVTVTGDADFDILVKDCKARDDQGQNSVALTDNQGCVLKPKLFGAFQKTRETGNSNAAIIAYAYFNAFKFPDVMELVFECNVELCKTDCQMCPNANQQIEPGKKRRRRSVDTSAVYGGKIDLTNENFRRLKRHAPVENITNEINEFFAGDSLDQPVKVTQKLRVIMPEDVENSSEQEVREALESNLSYYHDGYHVCLTLPGFLMISSFLVGLLLISSIFSVLVWFKYRNAKLKY